mmetsp:Transcript_58888/g.135877  ORF Transcript_58888/g.135877 Transcript_58888/m.135877 type:complete len:255 (-) Transcript_58888:14-778(-)
MPPKFWWTVPLCARLGDAIGSAPPTWTPPVLDSEDAIAKEEFDIGLAPESLRFKKMGPLPPTDIRRKAAQNAGGVVACDVCVAIFDMVGAGKENLYHDDVLDYVEEGCRSLFKRRLLQMGWQLTNETEHCGNATQYEFRVGEEELPGRWCVRRNVLGLAHFVGKGLHDTYSVANDALYYGCEATIGRYPEDIAAAIADADSTYRSVRLNKVLDHACRKAGKCVTARAGAFIDKPKTRKEKAKAKKKRSKIGSEL